MTQISQSQVHAFPSTNASALDEATPYGGIAHEGLAALANTSDLPVLDTSSQVFTSSADRMRVRRSAGTSPAPVELKGQVDVFTDTSNTSHQILDTGLGSTITLGDGDNQVTLKGRVATLKAGDGNNVIDATQGRHSAVTLGNGNNRYSGSSLSLSMGDGNNVVSGGADHVYMGHGNNQFMGSFESGLEVGDGNNEIRLTGSGSSITLGSGSNTIDAGGMTSFLLLLRSKGDTRVTNLTKHLSVNFGTRVRPEKVSVSRIGDDLVAARSGSTEKLTVVGYYGLASPPSVSFYAGKSVYEVSSSGKLPARWESPMA
ncbi:hypothetical protein [Bordetella sp. LUAb4]|uniref:hypothetical protein n=1 Tax=Bordetella sp. LUAb4 TaxID=2843195 RepID=UPI001E45837D|nr:hypothetical protein [Bordetella sp. LUAb4]